MEKLELVTVLFRQTTIKDVFLTKQFTSSFSKGKSDGGRRKQLKAPGIAFCNKS